MTDFPARSSVGSTASPDDAQSSHENGEMVPGGINDWILKRAALWTIYGGVSSNRELAYKITLGMPNPSRGASVLERCVECLSKSWPKYRPKGGYSLKFRDRIIAQINELIHGNLPNPTGQAIAGPMTADIFVNQPYSTFRRVFPQNPWGAILALAAGEELLGTRNDKLVTESKNKATYLQHVSSGLTFELPKAAIARGKVDQKLYYGNYEAVDNWEGVISARRYALWHGLGTTASIKSLKQRIDTRICSEREHSAIPGSITVELFLDLSKIPRRRIKRRSSKGRAPKRSLTLLTSTKYDPTSLIEFVERFGLKSEAIVDAPLFAHYKQFIFRFLPK